MNRFWIVLLVVLTSIARSSADVPKQAQEKDPTPAASAAEQFKATPEDQQAYRAFMSEYVQKIQLLARTNVAEAEKKLAELNVLLDSFGKLEGDADRNVTTARRTAGLLKDMVDLEKTPLSDLEAQLDANPHDATVLSKYFRKMYSQINSSVRSDSEKAEKLIASAKQRLEKGKEGLEKDSDKKQIDGFFRSIASAERVIESTKKLTAMIGKDAAPLEVEAWVNGSSLTDAELKGKVVLLDFWAVWCPPCIATFPHLREWQDKYSEKGLVIIGLTNYYQVHDFDTEKGSLKASPEPLTPEAEQEMLKKFAAHHKLQHRFGVQPKESKVGEYYGVYGIPHVVIIDQVGKIRMMKVGNTEENAKALGDMIEGLLSKAPAAGGK